MRRLTMASLSLLLAACTAAPPGVAPPDAEEEGWKGGSPAVGQPPPPRVGTAEVTFEPADARALSEVASVEVRLRVSGISGRCAVDAEFVAPGSVAYERRTRAVEAAPTETRELVFQLPVAGTDIPLYGMTGAWQVRFFLDGVPLTTANFHLERQP